MSHRHTATEPIEEKVRPGEGEVSSGEVSCRFSNRPTRSRLSTWSVQGKRRESHGFLRFAPEPVGEKVKSDAKL